MKNWLTFRIGDRKAKTTCKASRDIIETLGSQLKAFFPLSQAGRTQHIIEALTELGKKNGFKSMSNRISERLERKGFKKTEWLFDLHWYTEIEIDSRTVYQPSRLPLVVECEWGPLRPRDRNHDRFGAVKWDFHKLLVSNADLKLMIFRKRLCNEDENSKLDAYFEAAIESYENLRPGSRFLFVAFGKQEFHYTEKEKSMRLPISSFRQDGSRPPANRHESPPPPRRIYRMR